MNSVCSFDVPINRFLTYSGFYLIYLVFILMVVLTPDSDEKGLLTFGFIHYGLGVYASAYLFKDLCLMLVRKSLKTYFKFWRVLDLVTDLLLFIGIIMRFLTYHKIQHIVHEHILGTEFEEQAIRNALLASRIMLSLSATSSLLKLMYWFQLHDKVGPIVLNVSRVMTDIVTIFFVYIVTIVAYTVGLVLVRNIDLSGLVGISKSLHNETHDNASEFGLGQYVDWNSTSDSGTTVRDTIMTLFWATLGPGESDDIQAENLNGIVASVLFASYQILVAIIMLNLLIAIMNSSVQKVQDHQGVS